MSLKARIEAALFLTDKPIPALAIAQLVNADVQIVRQTILELIHDYEERATALEIADDNGYMMQVKDEFATIANDIAPIDLPVSVVRTLSAIAIKQPVLQSEIVRIRGAGAYEHVKELLEKELISKKEEGRSSLLSTTKKFQEYFRLSQDAKALRYQLKEQTEQEKDHDETILVDEAPISTDKVAVIAAQADELNNVIAVNDNVPTAEPGESPTTNFNIQQDEMDNSVTTTNTSPTDEADDSFIPPPMNALASSNM
jgi:segregation and condensation protein B